VSGGRSGALIRAVRWTVEHSLLLPIGALVALVWANIDFASYARLAHIIEFPVNEIGMAFFFGLAAKEVVEATVPGGALHPWRRAVVPLVAAVGGMLGPALLYLALVGWVGAPDLARGWAIPCATDIAFSYLVARAIFDKSHPALPFLLLLAIADDALGLVILAIFYPVRAVQPFVVFVLIGLAVVVAAFLKRRHVTSFWPYILAAGSLSWTGLFVGGLHPALALVPIVPFFPHSSDDVEPRKPDTLSAFEHYWQNPVRVMLFAFGLANAGVPVREVGTATWVVLGAILAGKPIGIALAVALAVVAGFHLPPRMTWRDVLVSGSTAGIGFTVALFFAVAAFPDGRTLDEAKLGALLSVGSAGLAYFGARLLRSGRFRVSPAGRPG
jgi:NhaA family Na+:H+ antiporter